MKQQNLFYLAIFLVLSSACDNIQNRNSQTTQSTNNQTVTDPFDFISKNLDVGSTKIRSCQFQFSNEKSDKYSKIVRDFARKTFPASWFRSELNKKIKVGLFERYADLFDQNYQSKIKNSEIKLFADPISDSQILKRPKAALYRGHENTTKNSGTIIYRRNLNDSSNSADISIEIHDRFYESEEGHSYVDFANKLIGGGALGNGFVQEEIEMFKTTFFPLLVDMRGEEKFVVKSIPGNCAIRLDQLDTKPVVLSSLFFIEVVLNHGALNLYGRNLFTAAASKVKPEKILVNDTAKNIFLIAMAAPNLSGRTGNAYQQGELRQIFLTAYHGFLNAMLALHSQGQNTIHIHTGHWGTGAFKNNKKMMALLQLDAFLSAQMNYKEIVGANKKPLSFHYEAGSDTNSVSKAFDKYFNDSVSGGIFDQIYQVGFTLEQGIEEIHNQLSATWLIGT